MEQDVRATLEWVRAYLASGEAKNPRGRPGVYRIDPKYFVPWVGRQHGMAEADVLERLDEAADAVGGARYQVATDRSDEVRDGQPPVSSPSWVEWFLPRDAVDEPPDE